MVAALSGPQNDFETPSQGIEILGAFLADGVDSARGLFAQRFATTAGLVGQSPLGDKRIDLIIQLIRD